ncbi:MAG: outer membrane lipoprotein carrier protein LolA [Prevotellaceae bacterium]|jgi:outer membrane lipoprotein-sorting protein|nr:outer membrane lipoprotein carrier protein LolA [Prevotellaceae bacterium]
MKRFFLLPAACMSFCMGVNAQDVAPATGEQQQAMLKNIAALSGKMKSLTCDFEQVKEIAMLSEKMASKGKMYYRHDNRVRWEYVSPYAYTLIMNNHKILLQSGGNKNVIDGKSSQLFQGIISIMTSSINGAGLTDSKNFKADLYWGEKRREVVLTPLQKEVKQTFSHIKLTISIKDYSVDKVEMKEPGGDVTIIQLLNKRFNEEIADSKFSID